MGRYLCLLIVCLCCGAQSKSGDPLFGRMTRTERRLLFYPEDNVSHHDITFIPSKHLGQERLPQIYITFLALDETFDLKLQRNDRLLMPEFHVREMLNNITNISHFPNSTCFYQGSSIRHPKSTVAVSLCNGMKGLIQTKRGVYIIQPLPEKTEKRLGIYSNGSMPHLIIKKQDTVRYTCPHARRKKDFYIKNSSLVDKYIFMPQGQTRYRRATTLGDPRVETAVFLDQALYENLKRVFQKKVDQQIITYVLTMMNAVQILFRHPSLGRSPEIKLVQMDILKVQPPDLEASENIDTYLTNFCVWQLKRRKSSGLWWDHALLLSGINMYVIDELGRRKKHVVGLAPVSGMCNPLNSCTISEGTSFQTVLVVAHEFGHSIGMEHDGRQDDNHCNPEKYIMSHTLGPGKTTWSTCSQEYLEKFLRSSQAHCLQSTHTNANMLRKLPTVLLPGQAYGSDKQCQMRYGSNSKRSTFLRIDEICHMLRCDVELGGKDISLTAHPALEGTDCGRDKWCRGGTCVNAQWRYGRSGRIDGGWSAWSSFGPCSSDCVASRNVAAVGVMTSTRRCDNPRPSGTGRHCQGADRRVKICDASRLCSSAARAMTLNEYIADTCRQAAQLDRTLDPTGTQFPSHDNSHSCYVWCHKKQGGYITHGWKLPDGTSCWRGYHSQNQYCIQGKCSTFDCNGYTIGTSNEVACPTRPSLATVHTEKWRPWKKVTDCRHSCIVGGKGYHLISRECNTVTGCTGMQETLQLCEATTKCREIQSVEEYATNLCKKYRNRYPTVLSGEGRQLPPRSGNANTACTVACKDQVWKGTHYQMDAFEDGKFPSGTDCSGGSFRKSAYCLNGKCVEFDDEKFPKNEEIDYTSQFKKIYKHSRIRRDTSGSSYILESDYANTIYHDYIIGRGSQENEQIKTKMKKYNFINRALYSHNWAIEMSECSHPCGGGIRNISLFCVKGNKRVEDRFCEFIRKPLESGTQPCNIHECSGKWHVREWQSCSVTCGEGVQIRDVLCVQQLTDSLYSVVPHSNCPRNNYTVKKCILPNCP